jgi:transglutaminase-like putative cysteine protease
MNTNYKEHEDYMSPTPILDYESPSIQEVLSELKAAGDSREQRIAAYFFVRDRVLFGYNNDRDSIPASQVLQDGIGHCNTKSTLLGALLRGLGVPCRFHFFWIDKKVQQGIFPKHIYEHHIKDGVLHAWVEAFTGERWATLEGVILDQNYLDSARKLFRETKKFEGWGISCPDLSTVSTDWDGEGDTFIQKDSIVKDYGIFSSPDDYYDKHSDNLSNMNPIKRLIYRYLISKILTRRAEKFRQKRMP